MKTPRPFQQVAVNIMKDRMGYLLGDECGLGKTVSSIEAAKASRGTGAWLGLVVCPKSLVLQWVDALEDQDPSTPVYVNNYLPYAYLRLNPEAPCWVIVTYPELHNNSVRALLAGVLWDIIIADEAHRIKNRVIKVTRHLKAIPKVKAFALTGTPMETTIADLWSIMNFIRPDKFDNYHRFVNAWVATKKGYRNHTVLGGPKDPKAFGIMMAEYMLRRTKRQVAPELPELIVIHEKIQMSTEQKKAYDILATSKDVLVTVEDQEFLIGNVLTLITKIQQLSSYPHLIGLKDMESGKLAWLDDFIEDHADEPTVVFTRFREVALMLAQKYNGACVVGGVNKSEMFLNGGTNLLFGTIDSMGEGFNLQRAKNEVFIDGHWSARQMAQARDRVHRMDITEPKTMYLLEACREDRLIYQAVDQKWSDAEFVFHYLND